MAGPAIIFQDVGLTLGGNEILTGISLRLDAGRIHAIVGPNGGGKTSLMLALLGQMPHSGTIRFEGGASPPRIGYAPQMLEFDRTLPLTVGDIMAVMTQGRPAFSGYSAARRAGWTAALDEVGLAGMVGRRFGALSGGERQRVLLAQALDPMPDLLVMDEPTANMDREGHGRTEAVVARLRAEGRTVLWVNHDWDQVRRVADTVTGIQRTILFHGRPAEVLPHPVGVRP